MPLRGLLIVSCAAGCLLIPLSAFAQQTLPAFKAAVGGPRGSSFESLPPAGGAATMPGRDGISLEQLQQLALANNPTLVQASARIRAARGAAYQAGLFLNPVVGYLGDQIGIQGTAGEMQGGMVSQEFVTGGKLRLSRAKYGQRLQIAETFRFVQQQRVVNDITIGFYHALATQAKVEITQKLLDNGKDSVLTHQEMVSLGQANHADLLQTEVNLQQDRLSLGNAQLDADLAWRELTAIVGKPELAPTVLTGTLEFGEQPLDWETAISQLLDGSPELTAAWQHVRHDEIAIQRERVQPIPNLQVNLAAGHNFETSDAVAGVFVGVQIPLFDRNQGTVRQAQADLIRSRANVKRLELELRARLAQQFRQYRAAWNHVHDYQTIMLPKSKQAYELLGKNYQARRIAWPDVLAAQRTYLNLQLEYLQQLASYRAADVVIRGMLLTGGLTEPAGAISGGHRDSVPKPR